MRRKNYDDNVIIPRKFTYAELRESGVNPVSALRISRELERWGKAEDAGLVRLIAIPDNEPYDPGDMFTREGCEGLGWNDKRRKAEEKKFFDKVNANGVWGLETQFRTSLDEEWETVDSLWGIVVFNESPNDTLEAFAAHDMSLGETVDKLEYSLCNVASI